MRMRELVCLSALMVLVPATARADEKADEQAIRDMITAYEKGLNTGDAAGIMKMYKADAVLMVPNTPTAVGHEAVAKVYEGAFKTFKFDVKVTVDEVKVLSDTWAMGRTHSKYTLKEGDAPPVPDDGQELFLFQKEGGRWRIARYGFSSTNPARK